MKDFLISLVLVCIILLAFFGILYLVTGVEWGVDRSIIAYKSNLYDWIITEYSDNGDMKAIYRNDSCPILKNFRPDNIWVFDEYGKKIKLSKYKVVVRRISQEERYKDTVEEKPLDKEE